jgi:hypothetical protein
VARDAFLEERGVREALDHLLSVERDAGHEGEPAGYLLSIDELPTTDAMVPVGGVAECIADIVAAVVGGVDGRPPGSIDVEVNLAMPQ